MMVLYFKEIKRTDVASLYKDIRKHISFLFIKYDCYRHIPVFNRLNRIQTTDVTANVCTDIKKMCHCTFTGLKINHWLGIMKWRDREADEGFHSMNIKLGLCWFQMALLSIGGWDWQQLHAGYWFVPVLTSPSPSGWRPFSTQYVCIHCYLLHLFKCF